MKFLVDAQLPPALATYLESQGFESKAVREVGLREADDDAIWAFADSGTWVVVTKDEDFVERILVRQSGPQVVWVRLGNCTNQELLKALKPILPDVLRELNAGSQLVEIRRRGRGKGTTNRE